MTSAIGVCLRPEYDTYAPERMAEYAGVAEKNGFQSVWVAESWGLDATNVLAYIGARTERIGLGTAIINVYSRTPGLLAMTAATINDLCPGRFILGLGTSTKAIIEGWHGMPFDKPLSRMRDAVEIVRQATAGAEVHHQGKVVSVDGYRLRIHPKSPPPPIYLAALGEESVKAVSQIADGWIPYLLPMRGVEESAAKIKAGAVEAGRSADAVTIAPMMLTAVHEDADKARDAARHHIGFYLGAMGPHYRGFVSRFGFEGPVEAIRAAWAAKDREAAFAAVTDELLDELAVAGTPQECREKFSSLRARGADLPIVFFPGTCSNEMVELALDTLATSGGAA